MLTPHWGMAKSAHTVKPDNWRVCLHYDTVPVGCCENLIFRPVPPRFGASRKPQIVAHIIGDCFPFVALGAALAKGSLCIFLCPREAHPPALQLLSGARPSVEPAKNCAGRGLEKAERLGAPRLLEGSPCQAKPLAPILGIRGQESDGVIGWITSGAPGSRDKDRCTPRKTPSSSAQRRTRVSSRCSG